jgi:hypothetical protein
MTRIDGLQDAMKRSTVIGLGGAGLLLIGVVVSPEQFFRSYLYGYMVWTGLAVGALGILLLHHLVSGAWGHIIQRIVEAAARTIPFMAILFLPLLGGMNVLYPWTREEVVRESHVLLHKTGYLNISFFAARVAVFFLLWTIAAYWLSGTSRQQDKTGDTALTRKMKLFSAPALVLFVITVTLASVDLLMSLEPEWYSTIYGMHTIVGMVLTALAFCVLLLNSLSERPPFAGLLTTRHSHHIGNMMFAFTILWAYMAFSQFLIIWSGNLPEDNFWYVRRMGGGWNLLAVVLLVGHFFVPFTLLLSRRRKRYLRNLSRVALLILAMRFLDYYWLISPAFYEEPQLHWLDAVAPLGIGGIWMTVFLRQIAGHPLIPLHDPRFADDGFHVHDIE